MSNPQLTPQDMQRVERYLKTGANATERKPFRPWVLLGSIWLVLLVFAGVSYLIALYHGVI